MHLFAPLFLFGLGCESKMEEADVKKMILDEFKTKNPTSGVLGVEIYGKNDTFQTKVFSNDCLQENEMALENRKDSSLIYPQYESQRWMTAATKGGFCVELGSDLSLDITSVELVTDQSQWDIQKVKFDFKVVDPSPWFDCIRSTIKSREVQVQNIDGKQEIDAASIGRLRFLSAEDNCPQPLPKSKSRGEESRPTSPPPSAPDLATVKQLISTFDGHIQKAEFDKAFAMVTCVDLHLAKWGRCAVSDILSHGPMDEGNAKGVVKKHIPWLDNHITNVDSFLKLSADEKAKSKKKKRRSKKEKSFTSDPTMFHALFKGLRSKKNEPLRSVTVVWRNGSWTLLGARQKKDEPGLLSLDFVNDLHDETARNIFERRLAGEDIDQAGNPPYNAVPDDQGKSK